MNLKLFLVLTYIIFPKIGQDQTSLDNTEGWLIGSQISEVLLDDKTSEQNSL